MLNHPSMFAMRWIMYALLIGCSAIIPRLDIDYFQMEYVFRETSECTAMEFLQSTFLLLCSVIFAISARHKLTNDQHRLNSMALLLCGFFSCLLIREADFFLDYILFDGAWQILVSVILISMCLYSWIERCHVIHDIRTFIQMKSFNLIIMGLLILVVYSRLFGQGIFWETLMGDNYMRPVKDVVEEGIELLATVIIFIGSIEYFFDTWRAQEG